MKNRTLKLTAGLIWLTLGIVTWFVFANNNSMNTSGTVISTSELVGRYVFQANFQDTIDVNSDNSFTYIRTIRNSSRSNGTWSHDSLNGQIFFNNFGGNGGTWSSKIEATENELHLIYATDISDGFYLKIDSIDRKTTHNNMY